MGADLSVFLGAMASMVGALVFGSGVSDYKYRPGLDRRTLSAMARMGAGVAVFAAGLAVIVLKPL